MVDVLAEDDGLGETVRGLEELRDFGGDDCGALCENEVLVEVTVVVFAVFDELPVFVGLPGIRPPAVEVFVEADADDFVGREEPVLDALSERVTEERLAALAVRPPKRTTALGMIAMRWRIPFMSLW